MCGGIWFQILGPQTEKARFLNWVRVLTTKAVSSGGTDLATSDFCGVELHHVTEICQRTLMMNGVHQGGDFELNSCLHRQPVKTL